MEILGGIFVVLIFGYFYASVLEILEKLSVFPDRLFPVFQVAGIAAAAILVFWLFQKLLKKNRDLLEKHKSRICTIASLLAYAVIFVSFDGLRSNYTSYDYRWLNLSFLNQILLFLIALVIACSIPFLSTHSLLKKYRTRANYIAMSLLAVYISFACIGTSLFFTGQEVWSVSFKKIYIFLLFAFWVFPAEALVLFFLEKLSLKVSGGSFGEKPERKKRRRVFFGIFLLLCVIWGIWLIACNPANTHVDTYSMLKEVIEGDHFTDWHPVLNKVFMWLCYQVIPHISFMVVVQILCFSAVCSLFFTFLWEKGIKYRTIVIFSVIFGMLPSNGLMVTTLLSNTIYTISVLWLMYLLVRLLDQIEYYQKWRNVFALGFALFCVNFSRNEGFIVTVMTFLAVVWISVLKKKFRVISSIAVFILAALLFKGPVYQHFHVTQMTESATMTPFADMVMATVHFGGNLSEETKEELWKYGPETAWIAEYNDYAVNDCDLYWDFVKDKRVGSFAGEAILKNLDIAFRIRLTKSAFVWDVTEPVDAHTARCVRENISNQFGYERKDNIVTLLLTKLYYPVTIMIPPLDIFLYRSGIYIILTLLCMIYLCSRKKGLYCTMYLPMIGVGASQLAAACWQGYRHVWVIFIGFWFLLMYLITLKKREE